MINFPLAKPFYFIIGQWTKLLDIALARVIISVDTGGVGLRENTSNIRGALADCVEFVDACRRGGTRATGNLPL